MPERIDYLEKMLGDSADTHAQELQALKEAHSKTASAQGKHAKHLESLQGLHSNHSSMNERMDYLESMLGDSAEKHAAELAALVPRWQIPPRGDS